MYHILCQREKRGTSKIQPKTILTKKQNPYSCMENIFLEELMNKLFNKIGECGIKVWCWRAYVHGLAGGTLLS